MAAQTPPMGDGAKFIVRFDSEGALPTVLLDDGNGKTTEIAECSPTATAEQFKWLVSSAATFHQIPMEVLHDGES